MSFANRLIHRLHPLIIGYRYSASGTAFTRFKLMAIGIFYINIFKGTFLTLIANPLNPLNPLPCFQQLVER